ncbi:hypothetical protein Mkiyose1665_38380 [Mycobacterium kiyosense]|uniref:M23ase beta-sheet core domain-containing protein n=1 Tax=Mycobacterium kiyosense TaxID=2871094 RepID=A0A9P3UUV3_9MYCO|nr:hypothetical protein IWGMT90018_40010 [Mycobacterium kiyosense]BDE13287.1 hypothetical protein MKCMC460_21470 [Mycobacterium sp. 20KCMC460]GLB83910.1 hypothetical protein SRL2020028_31660 [Mycobacterium kiyosense]GLB90889.1 hypothetical protein SRL2020130_37060 [Mycobacterium kiyosense]GLB96452.1 hypothetical protein SRL2020226_32280 [Mycobacterium kiyosense]
MLLVLLLGWVLLNAPPADAAGGRLGWPLRPAPAVLRGFDPPSQRWLAGHRGVDLAGHPGQPVYAAGDATVVFAGLLAGRPVVSLAHPGGLHTSYEPVRAVVRAGQFVTAGATLGALQAGHAGCPAAACLHWGAMWGPAARADYVDPLGLLESTPVRLKPLAPHPAQSRAGPGCGVTVQRGPAAAAARRHARGWAWSCTARSRETATWV